MGPAAGQGRFWGRAAHDWAELQEPVALPLWEVMLAVAIVGPGTRLLDAGCGAGGASVPAASLGAAVNGLDAAEALVAIARERVPDGDFRVGDVEALPYDDASFDAVLAADLLPYVADPLAALRELRRVCTPYGRVVLAVWCTPEQCDQWAILTAVYALCGQFIGEPFALSAPRLLEDLVTRAGLRVLGGGTVGCPAEYADLEMAWRAQVSAGPFQAALRMVGEQRLRAVVLEALVPYRTATGGVRMHNRFRYLTTAPAGDHDTEG